MVIHSPFQNRRIFFSSTKTNIKTHPIDSPNTLTLPSQLIKYRFFDNTMFSAAWRNTSALLEDSAKNLSPKLRFPAQQPAPACQAWRLRKNPPKKSIVASCFFGGFIRGSFGGFLKWWYPTTRGFPTKNDHVGVFWGYHHLRKHPFYQNENFGTNLNCKFFHCKKTGIPKRFGMEPATATPPDPSSVDSPWRWDFLQKIGTFFSPQHFTGKVSQFQFTSVTPKRNFLRFLLRIKYTKRLKKTESSYEIQKNVDIHLSRISSLHPEIHSVITRWWFQPIWKILVKLDHFPKYWWKLEKIAETTT